MSDKAIILSVILAAVLCVAVPFIFRVCRYRRRMKTLIVPDGPSGGGRRGDCPHPRPSTWPVTSACCGCLSPVTST